MFENWTRSVGVVSYFQTQCQRGQQLPGHGQDYMDTFGKL